MTPEFSRIIDIRLVKKEQGPLCFAATKEECDAIAQRFDLCALHQFEAFVKVFPLETMDPFMRLDISLNAQVTELCGVSMEEVEETIAEKFSLLLSHKEESQDLSVDEELQEWMHEEHETIYMGSQDLLELGEILVQYLSLTINPYPRHLQGDTPPQPLHLESESPFAKLKNVRKSD